MITSRLFHIHNETEIKHFTAWTDRNPDASVFLRSIKAQMSTQGSVIK